MILYQFLNLIFYLHNVILFYEFILLIPNSSIYNCCSHVLTYIFQPCYSIHNLPFLILVYDFLFIIFHSKFLFDLKFIQALLFSNICL